MSNQPNFQTVTMDLLKYLKSKKEALQARYVAELAAIENEIEAVATTARLIRETGEGFESASEVKPSVIPRDLSGKSAREACIEIAKKNGGVVRVADAKDALVSAGILKSGKNTWAIVYTTLKRSNEFEKGKKSGEFRLLTFPTREAAQASLLQ
jgi:hypothetical protein